MHNLNDMMVFLAVVEHQSFTLAADAISLPKSNISRKVSRLEVALGVRLLERSTRSLHLTEIGKTYYEHCVRINEEISNSQKCIETMSSVPRGVIKVCTSVTIGQSLIAPLLMKFNEVYPDIQVELQLTNRRVDIIEEGFDLVLRVGESPDSSLISKKLMSTCLKLYASPEYIHNTSKNQTIEISNLELHNCLFMNATNHSNQWVLNKQNETQTVKLQPSFVCDDFNVIYQMTLNGAGISLLPEYLCTDAISHNKLQQVLSSWQSTDISLYAIYASRKGVTPKIRAMIDFLENKL
ncbi:LysR family transcriptional regulator [Pseudoalteromonas sp. C2R02]|uniref:LysR family transcriptional regulator n=1 Tax=Pseudoalteromonas sp. C2R02 TaxID=2841565 RepID=UPI001C08CB34|nr:LysR family transcriptional regulator [Pseudoalteromonas sp. C2R02]MBU2969794.1 LysR family transcriptional regulator [Pseudoalteromonas sp. C2R02]